MTDSTKTAPPRLAHFPVPFFASVMGLSGFTLALHAGGFHRASLGALSITGLLFVTLAVFYTAKALRHPGAVRAEWQHPVKLAFFPAISISLLLIATALRPVSTDLARAVWVIGALTQASLTLAVLSNWIGHRPFQTPQMSPAWFIPAVGNIVAPVAGVGLGFVETAWIFFSAGVIFWIVLLVLVMNRLIFHDPLPGKMVPTLAITIAPPAVGFLAWLQLNGGVIDPLAHVFYGATIVFFGLALTQAGKLRGLPFALSWWALSFPIAAFTIATFKYGTLTQSAAHHSAGFALLALLTLIIVTLVIRTLGAIARREICVPE